MLSCGPPLGKEPAATKTAPYSRHNRAIQTASTGGRTAADGAAAWRRCRGIA